MVPTVLGHDCAELQEELHILDAECHILFPAQDVPLDELVVRDCLFHGLGALFEFLHPWLGVRVLLEHAGPVVRADGHVVKVYLFIAAVVEFLYSSLALTSMRSSSYPNKGSAVLKSDYLSD